MRWENSRMTWSNAWPGPSSQGKSRKVSSCKVHQRPFHQIDGYRSVPKFFDIFAHVKSKSSWSFWMDVHQSTTICLEDSMGVSSKIGHPPMNQVISIVDHHFPKPVQKVCKNHGEPTSPWRPFLSETLPRRAAASSDLRVACLQSHLPRQVMHSCIGAYGSLLLS